MTRQRLLACTVLLGCVVLGWQVGGADRFGKSSSEAREAVRLRLHFAEVEREMLARDISDLTPAQRAARAEQIRLLRRYSEAGAFPKNTYHPGQRTPYFRDANGNLCAMAFLIAASGRGDIVDHIARNRNYAFVPDLVDEPGLGEWLDAHGLTVAEAARIQPSYDGNPCCVLDDPPPARQPSRAYLMASFGTSTLAGLSVALNARSLDQMANRSAKGLFGIGAGTLSMAMGIAKVGDNGSENHAVGIWNLAVGATAAFLGGRSLLSRPKNQVNASRLRVMPVALGGSRPGIGFEGRLRF